VVPLVLATGAGASARKSIGITVFSGMIASTCLAVLFVSDVFSSSFKGSRTGSPSADGKTSNPQTIRQPGH